MSRRMDESMTKYVTVYKIVDFQYSHHTPLIYSNMVPDVDAMMLINNRIIDSLHIKSLHDKDLNKRFPYM